MDKALIQLIPKLKKMFSTNVVVGLILAALEKLVVVEFACPCKPELNAWFASAYSIIPGVAASVLMLFIRGFKCKTRRRYRNLALFGLGHLLTWLVLVFFDGQYFACARTDWSGRFVIIDKAAPQRWCEPDNNTLSEERMNQTQQWYFHSQVVGLGILVLSTTILVVCKCASKRNTCLRNKRPDDRKTSKHSPGRGDAITWKIDE